MGHITAKDAYPELRKRLDRYPFGAPESDTIYEILRLLYTEDEARLAARMPINEAPLATISRRTGIPEEELEPKLEAMAHKGLVLDLRHRGRTTYLLAPTVVGFFEMTMMRVDPDIDQQQLAALYERYMMEEPAFFGQFRDNETNLFRTLVHEDTLPEVYSEILDHERATAIISEANRFAVGLCHCRHTAHHNGRDCKQFKMESCLTLGSTCDYLVRRGFARDISGEEALDLLAASRDAGLVHICDNVRKRPSFICNCCGCCCELLRGFKKFEFVPNTFSSNFVARADAGGCSGCKKCRKACPVDSIDGAEAQRTAGGEKRRWLPAVDEGVCIGCGVCALACEDGAMQMKARPSRRLVPENHIARALTMASEQGKLLELIADASDGITTRAANNLIKAIFKLPKAKQLLVRDALKSRFVDDLFSGRSVRPRKR